MLNWAYTMLRSRSVRRARQQRPSEVAGFIVTWDVDSDNASQSSRLRRFVFGYTLHNNGRTYRYPGFIQRDGVRYLGQSVLFVTSESLPNLQRFLKNEGVPHVVMSAWLGSVMLS